jgi:hypothetical protein
VIAEQEDVPGQAFDGEILGHRTDEGLVGLFDHVVLGGVRDGTATGDSCQSSPTSGANAAMDAIPVQ